MAAVAAILPLIQLLWVFGLMFPASAIGGHANGALIASMIAAWFWATFALLGGCGHHAVDDTRRHDAKVAVLRSAAMTPSSP